jgi:hypothetical protein
MEQFNRDILETEQAPAYFPSRTSAYGLLDLVSNPIPVTRTVFSVHARPAEGYTVCTTDRNCTRAAEPSFCRILFDLKNWSSAHVSARIQSFAGAKHTALSGEIMTAAETLDSYPPKKLFIIVVLKRQE